MKKIKQIISILAIILIFFNIGANCLAVEINSANIVSRGETTRHLAYQGLPSLVKCTLVGYYDENGKFFPAYCLNKERDGAEKQGYTVNIHEVLNNDKVWRVVTNGYPYKTPAEMGLGNEGEAFTVTKLAIYCVLGQSDINKFSAPANDETAKKMLDILRNLYNIGINGTETRKTGTMRINKVGELQENEEYCFQEYNVSSSVNMSNYEVGLENLPEGSYVTGADNSAKNSFSASENFKVFVPKSSLTTDISGKINIKGKSETYPIFFGEAPSDSLQNYLVTYSSYGDENISTDLNILGNTGSLKICKVDSETKVPLEGIKFKLKNEEKNFEVEGETDENGEIYFGNLYQGNYILTETETNKDYKLEDKDFNISISYGKQTDFTIGNDILKGKVKIIKKDSKTGDRLEGVKFDIINKDSGEVIETLITDENGEALSSDLRIDKNYYLKETETLENYIINTETYDFNVKGNEITEIVIENEKIPEKEAVKILPKTGM